jgi:hypothetical protein
MKSSRLLLAFLFASVLAVSITAQRRGAAQPEGLAFRFLGPDVGNRSGVGVPGDPSIYYAGAASGSVWKTTDGSIRWVPVSDSMPVTAIGRSPSPSIQRRLGRHGEAWAIRDAT